MSCLVSTDIIESFSESLIKSVFKLVIVPGIDILVVVLPSVIVGLVLS